MKLDNIKNIKRLVIYFFYDADGIVDRYVPYMLEDINKNCSELFVIVNGKLTKEGRDTFLKLTPNVFVRENKGFDVWAYKVALEQYGWEKLETYDEVVLMNFTQYGPLYPFSEMFAEMNSRDIDFWGITKHHGFPFDPFGTIPYGYIPEHIQSSFIGIRTPMLKSLEFHHYWDHMGEVHSYGEAVGKHEAIFTKKFRECGFIDDVYIQTDDLKDYTHYPLMLESLELIKNRRCPVFKRKAFTNEYYEFLNASLGEPTVEMYDYIKNNLSYDLDMVWENILRTDNMADIKNRMHLNYVLPKDAFIQKEASDDKVALILHIYFEDMIDYCLEYARSMPDNADIIITTATDNNKKLIEKRSNILYPRNVKVLLVNNRGRDVSSLLVAAAPYVFNYDLICFAHDKKTKQMLPFSVGQSFSYKCFENVLGSKQYVSNIIATFAQNDRLGLMMPPPPNHGGYYGLFGTEWGDNYNLTVSTAKDLDINVNFDITKAPISPLGTMFWFRPNALKPLFEKKWKYEDFPKEPNKYDGTLLHAIERLYGFVAQSQGYYCAWTMHDKFAAIELTNLYFMLRETSMSIYGTCGHQSNFNMAQYNLINQLSFRSIFKEKMRKRIPPKMWSLLRRIYHVFRHKEHNN